MRKLAIVAGAAAVAALAACSSSSTTSSTSMPARSGTQTFAGTTHSLDNNPVIPLTASGVFHATGGRLHTGGPTNGKGKLYFPHGDILVTHHKTASHQSVTKNQCSFSYSETGTYVVTGGTGAYKGATGHGTYAVSGSGSAKPPASGKCTRSTKATKALTTFKASGPFKLP